ncbi:carbohydrate ABC transporter substrate-binding protein [Ruania alkalisoli]|uniref:Carbohydrate ABC transporter substrate-binding protein n=1 Tax=Ruania alkalisoli TaxID=2779775 RepID=A0A7M1SS60_9MICO|nr:carbohydrate ABC transporter substrate-binding protein [Ruania alkalisoli]QOR70410.1 carbohydrate ABC transporter substrate-binding protein [Ruania alkalisoli]
MTDYVGLTWDHPRGRNALEAAAPRLTGLTGTDTLRWEVQPLEGFESAAIADLARRYDVLVLDHPHLGDALAADCLHPIDGLLPPEVVQRLERGAVGASVRSYRFGSHLWALPLDAATQVSARRPDTVPDAPTSWDQAIAVAGTARVAMSLAGPHAFLTFCSIAVSLGGEYAGAIFERRTAQHALQIMTDLSANLPAGTEHLNPIGLLDRMRTAGDIDYLPLVYGYVNYSSRTLSFGPPPMARRIGSTIGGTGMALTRRSRPSPALLDHVLWLLDEHTQRTFIPTHDGQPSSRAAWSDPAVDAAAHGFYGATRATMEAAWVRPRFAGYVPAQSQASAIVRSVVLGGRSASEALDELEELFAHQPEAS